MSLKKYINGKDDWLFLANDSNNVIAQHVGEIPLPTSDLDLWNSEFETRHEVCNAVGAKYFCMVTPDKHAVYSDKLPELRTNGQRPVVQLINSQSERVRKSFCYPLDELKHGRKHGLVYAPTDTHWTDLGAAIGYEAMCCEVPMLQTGNKIGDIQFSKTTMEGDLGMAGPTLAATSSLATKTLKLLADNKIENIGQLKQYASEKACANCCIIFGNSFSSAYFINQVARNFEKTIFVFSANVDYELILREKPSLVIHQLTERFLVRLPRDRMHMNFKERATVKVIDKILNGYSQAQILACDTGPSILPEFGMIEALNAFRAHNYQEASRRFQQANQLDGMNALAFSWSLALAEFDQLKESISFLIRAKEGFPDRNLVVKFVRFLIRQGNMNGLHLVRDTFGQNFDRAGDE